MDQIQQLSVTTLHIYKAWIPIPVMFFDKGNMNLASWLALVWSPTGQGPNLGQTKINSAQSKLIGTVQQDK